MKSPPSKKKTTATQNSEAYLKPTQEEKNACESMYPKVLADKISFASFLFLKVGNTEEERLELLRRYRKNRCRLIATRGITFFDHPDHPIDNTPIHGYEHIPAEHYRAIELMDDAYHARRHFIEGGGMDYCAASVTAVVSRYLTSKRQSKSAALPRKQDTQNAAYDLWGQWQKDISLYENKQQFTNGVQRKCKVSQATARSWFDCFRAEKTSRKWEGSYGNKYPKKIQ